MRTEATPPRKNTAFLHDWARAQFEQNQRNDLHMMSTVTANATIVAEVWDGPTSPFQMFMQAATTPEVVCEWAAKI